jgi:hypothetical protein
MLILVQSLEFSEIHSSSSTFSSILSNPFLFKYSSISSILLSVRTYAHNMRIFLHTYKNMQKYAYTENAYFAYSAYSLSTLKQNKIREKEVFNDLSETFLMIFRQRWIF